MVCTAVSTVRVLLRINQSTLVQSSGRLSAWHVSRTILCCPCTFHRKISYSHQNYQKAKKVCDFQLKVKFHVSMIFCLLTAGPIWHTSRLKLSSNMRTNIYHPTTLVKFRFFSNKPKTERPQTLCF